MISPAILKAHMHFPSERMLSCLSLAEAGIWADRVNDGREVVLVVKLNTDTLKWIQRGVPVNLLIGHVAVDGKLFRVLGLEVFDCQADPLLPQMVQVSDWEVEEFDAVIEQNCFVVYFHNEQPFVSVLDMKASLPQDAVANYVHKRGELHLHTSPVITPIFQRAQDVFRMSLKRGDPQVQLVRWPLTLSDPVWNSVEVLEADTFIPEDKDEGLSHERLLMHVLKPNFSGTVIASPRIPEGDTTRELCDVLAMDQNAFLFEAKAFSVFEKTLSQSSDRKAASVLKQFEKGLGQLQGAVKRLEAGVELVNSESKGVRLVGSQFQTIHGIVLASNTSFDLPWMDIGAQLAAAQVAPRVHFHFISLMELQRMVAFSHSASESLNQMFLRRSEVIASSKDARLVTDYIPRLPTTLSIPAVDGDTLGLCFAWVSHDCANWLLKLFARVERLMFQREFSGRLDYWSSMGQVRDVPGIGIGLAVNSTSEKITAEWWDSLRDDLFGSSGRHELPPPLADSLTTASVGEIRARLPELLLTIEFKSGLAVAKNDGMR